MMKLLLYIAMMQNCLNSGIAQVALASNQYTSTAIKNFWDKILWLVNVNTMYLQYVISFPCLS